MKFFGALPLDAHHLVRTFSPLKEFTMTTPRDTAPMLSNRDLGDEGRRIWAAMEQVFGSKASALMEAEVPLDLLAIEVDIENAISLIPTGRISLLRWIDDDAEGHGRLVLQTPYENVQLFTYARDATVAL